MPGSTSRLSLQYESGSDVLSGFPARELSNLNTLDGAVLYSEGTLAARPAASIKGRIYRATDVGTNGTVYMDTGAAWFVVSPDTPEAAFSTYKDLVGVVGYAGPTTTGSSGTYGLPSSLANPMATALTQDGVFDLDPADRTAGSRTTKYRVKAWLATNQASPGTVTFTFGLYPVTVTYGAGTGAGSPNTYTLGTVVTGSTIAFVNPTASSGPTRGASADFTAPAVGYYAIGVNLTAAVAGGNRVDLRAVLQTRQV